MFDFELKIISDGGKVTFELDGKPIRDPESLTYVYQNGKGRISITWPVPYFGEPLGFFY